MAHKLQVLPKKTPPPATAWPGGVSAVAPGVPPLALRPALPEDDGFLFRVYAGLGAVVPDAPRMGLLRRQFEREDLRYRKSFPAADFSVVLRGAERIGRLYVDHGPERIRILDLALLPECRNSGLGSLLLTVLLVEADWVGKPLEVEVPRFHRALGLFERFGFRRTGGSDGLLVLEGATVGSRPSGRPAGLSPR